MWAPGCLPGGSEAAVKVLGLSHGGLLHLLPISVLGRGSRGAPFLSAESCFCCPVSVFPKSSRWEGCRGRRWGGGALGLGIMRRTASIP